MTHLVESLAVVACACLASFVALEYLKAWKRRNDLLDLFQAFQRETTELLQGTRLAGMQNEDAITQLQNRFDNLLGNHEKLKAGVIENDAYARKEISRLGGEILDEVKSMKTTQTAAFVRPPTAQGRILKP